MPLGFYTSQWLSNWYLMGLDHYIKEQLHVKYYERYMDDIVIFASNKRFLHKIKFKIEDFLSKIGLTIKDNWQVFRFHYIKNNVSKGRFVDFMGYKFYRNRITLRKSIFLKIKRKAAKISKKQKITIFDCKQMLSYNGKIIETNVHNAYLKYIKPYVSFKQLKVRISKYNKRKNERSVIVV